VRRREFITLLAAASCSSSTALAQVKTNRIGYVHTLGTSLPLSVSLLRPVWQQLGYVEGETIFLRGAEGDPSRLPGLVQELLDLQVRVLIVVGPAALRVAQGATSTTPIVAMDLETDPIRSGYARAFGRPGGNVTGLFLDQPLIAGKWLEILKEVLPSIERVALIWDPNSGTDQLRAAQDAARAIGVSTIVLEVRRTDGYDLAFESLNGHEGTGVVQLGTPVLTAPAAALGAAAAKYRLPTISFYTPHVRAGALIGYGPDLQTYFPRAAVMADKIVKGASPADLPIEQPTKFELVVNLKTARSLGIIIPPILHARADEVIE